MPKITRQKLTDDFNARVRRVQELTGLDFPHPIEMRPIGYGAQGCCMAAFAYPRPQTPEDYEKIVINEEFVEECFTKKTMYCNEFPYGFIIDPKTLEHMKIPAVESLDFMITHQLAHYCHFDHGQEFDKLMYYSMGKLVPGYHDRLRMQFDRFSGGGKEPDESSDNDEGLHAPVHIDRVEKWWLGTNRSDIVMKLNRNDKDLGEAGKLSIEAVNFFDATMNDWETAFESWHIGIAEIGDVDQDELGRFGYSHPERDDECVCVDNHAEPNSGKGPIKLTFSPSFVQECFEISKDGKNELKMFLLCNYPCLHDLLHSMRFR